MTETSFNPSAGRLPLGKLLLGAAAGAILALMLALVAGRAESGILAGLWSALTGRDTHIAGEGSVIERIQRLQRLETVVFSMDKIVTGSKENAVLPDFLAGDRLLMIVHGQVIAGIDFGQLKPSDLHVAGKEVRVKLPAARVLMTRLDNTKTRVYSRSTGLLVSMDQNLESQVRQEAEKELLAEAVLGGILNQARDNARTTVTGLLLGLGFEKVDVQ